MEGIRLLERMRACKADPLKRGRPGSHRLVESVVDHLQKFLNTRQGNVPIGADYGIPDLGSFMRNCPVSLNEIENGIRRAIAAYEPRLAAIEVSFMPREEDRLFLHFQITARLQGPSGRSLRMETIVEPDGKIEVKHC